MRENQAIKRPDVFAVLVDGTAYSDAQSFGGEDRMRKLQAPAASGIVFRHTHVAKESSVC